MRLGLLACLAAACGGGAAGGPDGGPAADAPAADAPDAPPPVYATCAEEPRATPESLAAKAARYDARALGLHATPAMPWVLDVQLAPGAEPTTAVAADVALWRSGENDGLWSSLTLAAEAYRFAVTRDAAALDAVVRLMEGERRRMRITGVPGLFTRQLIPPGVPGIACPADPALYVPSPDKRGNRWVRIDAAGCAEVADAATLTMTATSHCGLADFAGWCFLDNVSQDEYVGHLFALHAVARLVDDPQVRGLAVQLLGEIGTHLRTHGMEFVDWDGRPTQWGKVHPGAPGDTPGYLAVLGLAFLAVTADATGDPLLAAELDRAWGEAPAYFDQVLLWTGVDGCGSNWNDISMLIAAFYLAIGAEPDPVRRATLQDLWDREVMRAPVARAAAGQKNAWYDVLWAARKRIDGASGPGGPAFDEVRDALCQLRQFPASNHGVARDTAALAPHACDDRQGVSLAALPFDVADRCAATYAWWRNPYRRETCADEPERVDSPAGYLLPYWMGRYHGFVAAGE